MVEGLGYSDGPVYWNQRYSIKSKSEPFEWIVQWEDMAHVFDAYFKKSKDLRFLEAGCGNSLLAERMNSSGYCNVTSIDNSDIVISQMKQKTGETVGPDSSLQFICMDACSMTFENDSFDVVLEKSLLDCLGCATSLDSGPNIQVARYLKEVIRVLVPNGLFLCISLVPSRAQFLEATPWKFKMLETVQLSSRCTVYVCQKTKASNDMLVEWPETMHALLLGFTEDDLANIESEGSWTSVNDGELRVGDVIEVREEFCSGDASDRQVLLAKGLRGIVRLVDDADAIIRFRFPCRGLDLNAGPDHFVMRDHLENLQVRKQAQC